MLPRETMRCSLKFLLVVAGAAALFGAVACGSAGTELNPQPLPPVTPEPSEDRGKGNATGSDRPAAGGVGDGGLQDSGDGSDADAARGDQ